MQTISSCLIVKNEINNIPGLIDDLKQFSDEIIIVDTGSNDGTAEWLQANQDNILKYDYFEWIQDFAAARNYSFSKATGDWIFWCDADDRLSEKLINDIKNFKYKLENTEFNSFYINYKFGPDIYVPRRRLLKRSINPRWVGACHEYVYADNLIDSFNSFDQNESLIIHQREYGHPSRNLPIFIHTILRNDYVSGRDMYYFSNELRDNGYIEKSIEVAKIAIGLEDMCIFDTWNAMIYTLDSYWRFSEVNAKEGISFITNFMKDHDMRGDVYYLLSILYSIIGDTDNQLKYCDLALNTEVDNIFNYGIHEGYAKIYPAMDLYINAGDNESLKKYTIEHLKKYKNNSDVIRFFNTYDIN